MVLFGLFYVTGILLLPMPVHQVILISMILFLFLFLFFFKKFRNKGFTYAFLLFIPVCLLLGYYQIKKVKTEHPLEVAFDTKTECSIEGTIKWMEPKGNYLNLELDDVVVFLEEEEYLCRGILVLEEMEEKKSGNELRLGNKIRVKGVLYKFTSPTNSGQFDEVSYYKAKSIEYKLFSQEKILLDSNYSKYHQFLYSLRSKLVQVFSDILPVKEAGMISAMLLNDKSKLDTELNEAYKISGISHLIAISGLHITLMGMVIATLLKRLHCHPVLVCILSVCFMYSYGILINFGVSATRAILMFFILMGGKLIGRTYDLLSATAFSGIILLWLSPMELYQAGFLLSFGAILGIAWINPVFLELFPTKWSVLKGISACISIQLVTIPISMYYFFEISTYGIIVNALTIPFSSLLLILGAICGVFGMIFLPLSQFFAGGVYIILSFYEKVSTFHAMLPRSVLLTGRPPFFLIIIYYLVIVIFLLVNYKPKRKITLLILIGLFFIFLRPTSQLEVTFLDVGQGDSIFVKTPSDTVYLIDGGSSSVNKVGSGRIIPFLKSKGIWKVDYVFLTHMDGDHISGVLEILEAMKEGREEYYHKSIWIRQLVLSEERKDDQEEIKRLQVVELAKELGVKVIYMKEGDKMKDKEITITCLHPTGAFQSSNENARSLVLYLRYKKFSMLLTGDIEKEGEVACIEKLKKKRYLNDSDITVLKVAHHGSKYSTIPSFLEEIKPAYSIISSGKNNTYGHPHKELLDRLEGIKSVIYTTIQSGGVTIWTDGEYMEIEGYVN